MNQTFEMKPIESTTVTISTDDNENQKYLQKQQLNLRNNSFICTFKKKSRTKPYLIKIISVLVVLFILAAIIFYYNAIIKRYNNICLTKECILTASKILDSIDFSYDPCENFYKFSCANWQKNNKLTKTMPAIDHFITIELKLFQKIQSILEANITADDNIGVVIAKNFYISCISETKPFILKRSFLSRYINEHLGEWPVTSTNWSEPKNVEPFLSNLRKIFDISLLIVSFIAPDERNSSKHIIKLDQPTFDFPTRNNSEDEIVNFINMMTHAAILGGAEIETARSEMNDVFQFALKIVNISVPEEERQDDEVLYNKMSIKELSKNISGIDWLYYLQSTVNENITENEMVVVYSPSYFQKLASLLKETKMKVIYNFGIFQAVDNILRYMPGSYRIFWSLFEKAHVGAEFSNSRDTLCLELTKNRLGLAISSKYIKLYFNEDSKNLVLEMVKYIRQAFYQLLIESSWMDEKTKAIALDKAKSMKESIGFSKEILNNTFVEEFYQSLNLTEFDFVQNMLRYFVFRAQKSFDKFGKPNSKKTIQIPIIANAFYSLMTNEIMFPAGILEEPFFSKYFPKSVNFGSIGVFIGHEMTHGFDSQGRKYDKNGELDNWWKYESHKMFNYKAKCMVEQYDSYIEEEVNLKCNGRLNLAENIADNGGLKESYRAYKAWEKENGGEMLLPGLNMTHDQLFFLAFAQGFCENVKPEFRKDLMESDVHSSSASRVRGTLSNSPDFAKAFSCKLGNTMNPVEKCAVW